MFRKIMVPVDLAHSDEMNRAIEAAAVLGQAGGSEIIFVGVTSPQPNAIAHSPEEFATKLDAFAAGQAGQLGLATSSHAETAHDPTTELDDALIRAVKATGADCVVMASHDPGLADLVWPSNGGKVATHAHCSVFLIRP